MISSGDAFPLLCFSLVLLVLWLLRVAQQRHLRVLKMNLERIARHWFLIGMVVVISLAKLYPAIGMKGGES